MSATAVKKAIRPDLLAPKRKHVRKIVVDSWNYSNVNIFRVFEKDGSVTKNGCSCFKALTVIHKVLQEGSPRFLKRSYNAINFIRIIQNFWSTSGSHDVHYAKLNAEYAYFIRGKITFHYKHPLVLGKLSLDDYQQKIKNQPEVPLQTRQQMISHLLDLQEMILRVQDTIFSFHGRDLHESKKSALVPLVVESDAIINIFVHHMTALCERTNDMDVVKRYIERYHSHYPRFRLFFDNASRIPYVTALVKVPQLPADPPQFVATGTLADLVPIPDQIISISSLMIDETSQNNPQQSSQQGNNQGNNTPNPPPKPTDEDNNSNSEESRELKQEEESTDSKQEENKSTPVGWVAFGQPQTATESSTPQVQVAESGNIAAIQPQSGTLNNDSNSEIDQLKSRMLALEKLVQQKDAEANYWKQMCANALHQAQGYNNACEANKQRGDELEQHLNDILQQQQKEKEDRLMRKLDNAVINVQNALTRLTDSEVPSNLSSTPEQILTAHQAVLAALINVEGAANSRDHQELIASTKKLVAAGVEQSEHSKGVAKLTDNEDLSNELSSAAENATQSIRVLLETIKENPYDAYPIVTQCDDVRQTSILLEKATQNIIDSEKVQDAEEDLPDKATSELMNAARVIEEAAKTLAEAKKRAEEKAKNDENKQDMEVAGSIVGGAMAITDAIQTLIKYATLLQKENVEAGRSRGDKTVYKKDVAWSEGLISAASSVAASVQDLVTKADGAVSGDVESEAMVVSSKQVAAATAQLLVASRVRSDPNSSNQKNLEAASKAVSQATRTLVIASQQEIKRETIEEEQRDLVSGLSLTEVKIKEMEQQAEILKLEKQLELSRVRLASMRKAQYEKE